MDAAKRYPRVAALVRELNAVGMTRPKDIRKVLTAVARSVEAYNATNRAGAMGGVGVVLEGIRGGWN